MKDSTFIMVLVCGIFAIASLLAAGAFLNEPFVIKMAVVSAGAMYVCQMCDALAEEFGGRWRLLYGAAFVCWASAIIAAVVGILALVIA